MDNLCVICLSLLHTQSIFSYFLFSLGNCFFAVICFFLTVNKQIDNKIFELLTYYKFPLQLNA